MFDYNKFGHMTKEELLFSFKQYEGTGVTYKVMGEVAHDCGSEVGKVSVIFSFNKEKEDD